MMILYLMLQLERYIFLIKAFGLIINNCNTGSAEIFAKYCDFMLKKNNKLVTGEKQVEEKIMKAVILHITQQIDLFTYIEDKDVFQKFYSRFLAKRLIHCTSISEDLEMIGLENIKSVCGYGYTSKLQRMFMDIKISGELSKHFKIYIEENNIKYDGEFLVNVLTQGSWPFTGSDLEYKLPLQVFIRLTKLISSNKTFQFLQTFILNVIQAVNYHGIIIYRVLILS